MPPVSEYQDPAWTPYERRHWKIRTHNHEMGENQVDRAHFRFVHGRFHEGGPGFGWTELFWTAAIVIGITLAVWLAMLYMQRRERSSYYSPKKLLRELCNAHRLTWAESWLLSRLASGLKLAQPASLFLRPELFATPHVPAALAERQPELKALRERIFATGNA